ncbi:hypothetical protein OAB01_02710 [Bacteroidia bacterium]|nr:hypothetical protein [Bacteroidia bacterium]
MESNQKDKKSKIFLYAVIAILAITNGLLGYKLYTGKKDNVFLTQQNETLNEDRKSLEEELTSLSNELEATKSSEAQKDSAISELQTQLERKVAQLRTALNGKNLSKKELTKLRAEISSLRAESTAFQNKIRALEDELAVTTQNLNQTTTKLTAEKQVTEKLNTTIAQKEAVIAKGKQLIADQVSVTGIKIRKSGKEVETSKTRRTDAIKATFRIQENKIADAGDKPLYVKITGPDGVTFEPLNGSNGEFQLADGGAAKYSVMKIIDYKNTDQIVDVYHKKGTEYAEGIYSVEVFADKVSIGKSSVTLR